VWCVVLWLGVVPLPPAGSICPVGSDVVSGLLSAYA